MFSVQSRRLYHIDVVWCGRCWVIKTEDGHCVECNIIRNSIIIYAYRNPFWPINVGSTYACYQMFDPFSRWFSCGSPKYNETTILFWLVQFSCSFQLSLCAYLWHTLEMYDFADSQYLFRRFQLTYVARTRFQFYYMYIHSHTFNNKCLINVCKFFLSSPCALLFFFVFAQIVGLIVRLFGMTKQPKKM